MKSFACGDVVPGCSATWLLSSNEELVAATAVHARDGHGLAELPAEPAEQVRSKILVAAG